MQHIVLLGFGAIGRDIAQQLAPEIAAGEITLTAVVRSLAGHAGRDDLGAAVRTADDAQWDQLIGTADVVVECASVAAAVDLAPAVISAGADLVLTSVGALADDSARASLLGGPGRLWVTNGAIGGFDVLGAAADAHGLDSISIRTAKLAGSLVQPWMSESQARRLTQLRRGDDPITVFQGDPISAIRKFPANVNVSAALAWATRGLPQSGATSDLQLMASSLQRVQVCLLADPDAELSRHEVLAHGPAGRFEFTFESAPSPNNPKTSGLTALSVVRSLRAALQAPPLR
ncbi:aspartate dehydrogenase domain-containing protein [Garicola koreensis]|uniref:L-aspartate dehydrogenase n=1 Tax=Garicola koreensis TaxID=1262554 RepID=A0A7W5TWI0_9MICC|nr:aspartate dehydrogenase domain-containing protein [Garicola koreensis]MBB3667924.1 aspartate dehydrogenase [Garicola koreensis]